MLNSKGHSVHNAAPRRRDNTTTLGGFGLEAGLDFNNTSDNCQSAVTGFLTCHVIVPLTDTRADGAASGVVRNAYKAPLEGNKGPLSRLRNRSIRHRCVV